MYVGSYFKIRLLLHGSLHKGRLLLHGLGRTGCGCMVQPVSIWLLMHGSGIVTKCSGTGHDPGGWEGLVHARVPALMQL